MPLETDRVRRHTARAVLERIDHETSRHLAAAAVGDALASARLQALDRGWDIDRAVEAEAAAVGLLGLAVDS